METNFFPFQLPSYVVFLVSILFGREEREETGQNVQVHTFVFLIRFPMNYRR